MRTKKDFSWKTQTCLNKNLWYFRIFSSFSFIFFLIVQNSHLLLIIHIFWRAHTTESATLWSSKEFKYSFTKYSLNGREIFPDEVWSQRWRRWNDTESEKIEKNTLAATMLIHFRGDNLFHFLGLWKIQVNSVIVIDLLWRLSHCSDKQKRPKLRVRVKLGHNELPIRFQVDVCRFPFFFFLIFPLVIPPPPVFELHLLILAQQQFFWEKNEKEKLRALV